jgi:murein DD-endopeptidase MepM/ murein hydrolase activator NlpD
MARKFYTFIIVPDASSRLHKVRISARVMSVLTTVGFLSLFVALGLGFNYAKMAFRMADYNQLRAENTELRVEKKNLEVSTQKLGTKISALENLSAKITNLIESDTWNKRFANLSLAGTGGTKVDYPTLDIVRASDLKANVENLKDRTSELESDLKLIEQVAERRATMIRFTPTIWPLNGRIGSHYGRRLDPFTGVAETHRGLDIVGLYGSIVRAPADGVVIYSARKSDYGNLIIIEHGQGLTTRYGHLSRFGVRSGQKVAKGEIIGYVGTTGRSTGPHLHYEVRLNDRPVNPRNYLPRG